MKIMTWALILAVCIGAILVDTAPIRLRCWFSKFWDLHDYPLSKGGDGIPTHFFTYVCWNCGKRFRI